ncbi:MAG: response regulator transcription factor [Myxococcota bacterium]
MSTEPRVFVVDDDEPFRRSVVFLLRSAGFATQGFAAVEEFLAFPAPDEVGCVVTDLRMPGSSGLDLQAALLGRGSTLGIVFISAFAGVRDATQAMRDGAVDFLEKPLDADRLVARVRDAIAWSAQERQRREANLRVASCWQRLTPREREIMEAVAAGQRSRDIALALGISPRTVEVHRARIMEKMEVESIADLVRCAMLLRDGKAAAAAVEDREKGS